MFDTERFLRLLFVHPLGTNHNHFLLTRANRTRLISEALDCGLIAVSGNQRVECLDEMPCGTIHPRLVRRMNVFARSASPKLSARGEFQLDHSLRPKSDGNNTIKVLNCRWHKD